MAKPKSVSLSPAATTPAVTGTGTTSATAPMAPAPVPVTTTTAPAGKPTKSASGKQQPQQNWNQVVLNLADYYTKSTPQRTKLIDVFMAFLVVVGALQFVYCVLAGNYVRTFSPPPFFFFAYHPFFSVRDFNC